MEVDFDVTKAFEPTELEGICNATNNFGDVDFPHVTDVPSAKNHVANSKTLKLIIIPTVIEIVAISNKINVAIVSLVDILNEVGVVVIDADVIAKKIIRAEEANTSNVIIIRRKMSIFEFNL
jgi:hypothetical protein